MERMAENKTVSIVIPVYNVAAYLDACLTSVTRQTYASLEIILINDGSSDDSLFVCKAWQEKDARILVYSNENHGVSYTRNFGIAHASGEYLTFVDADDCIAENYIEDLVCLLASNDADMAITSHCSFVDGQTPNFTVGEQVTLWKKNLETAFFTVVKGTIASKLYKNAYVQRYNVRFDETIAVCEDFAFNFDYIKHCCSIAISNAKLYGYRQRHNSAAHSTVSLKWFSCLDVYKKFFENYSENPAYRYIVFYYLKNLYEADYIVKHKQVDKSKIKVDIKREIKRAEKKRNLLDTKELLKLFVCKYFFFVVEKRRKS